MSICGFVTPRGTCGNLGDGDGGHCKRHGCPKCGAGKSSSDVHCVKCSSMPPPASAVEERRQAREGDVHVEHRMAAAIGMVNGATVFSRDEKRRLIQSMIMLQLGLEELKDVCDVQFLLQSRLKDRK